MDRSQDRLLPVLVSAPQDGGPKDGAWGERVQGVGARASRPSNSYAAQMFGQDGRKRGLRGGAPVLEAARSAYLGAEYSGENDRRPSSGLIMRTAI